jgi:hypothetical protein
VHEGAAHPAALVALPHPERAEAEGSLCPVSGVRCRYRRMQVSAERAGGRRLVLDVLKPFAGALSGKLGRRDR